MSHDSTSSWRPSDEPRGPGAQPGGPGSQPSQPVDDGPSTAVWSFLDEETGPIGESPAPPTTHTPRRALSHDESERIARSELLIGDRYRLEEQLVERDATLTWRAYDEKLTRPVLVHVLPAGDPRNEDVLEAAKQASIATDARFLKVLDAAPVHDATYIVCEFVPGQSLRELLAKGPLSGLEAGWIVREVADALAPMHARGLFHRRLNPDTIVITATGNVKIVGFLLEAALHPDDEAVRWSEREDADVAALGRLLYAMLVSRWPQDDPAEDSFDLPTQPREPHGWPTPRQVQPAVSPALDTVCDQILSTHPQRGEPRITSMAQVGAALAKVLGTADASPDLEHRIRHPSPPRTTPPPTSAGAVVAAPPAPPAARPASSTTSRPIAPVRRSRPPRHRRWLIMLVALLALTLVASLITVAVRRGQRGEDAGPPVTPNRPASSAVLPIASVNDFDPTADGGNDEENPNQVALAWDKKPATSWTTLTYKGSPQLGKLKPGVGLVVDLGQPVALGKVTLTLVGQPTHVQLLVPKNASSPSMTSVKQWTMVADQNATSTTCVLTPKQATTTRYVLVYLTSLPQVAAGKYRGGIAEIEVSR